MEEYGTIRIKLDELIEKSGISKNKLSHKAWYFSNNELSKSSSIGNRLLEF